MVTHRPMVGVVVCFGLGIFLEPHLKLSMSQQGMVALGFLFFSWLMAHRIKLSGLFLGFGLIFLGSVHAVNHGTLPQDHILKVAQFYRNKQTQLRGVIVSHVENRNTFYGQKTTFLLSVQELKTPWGWRPKSGRVLVNLFKPADLQYGDWVLLEGKMYRPFNFSFEKNFSYADYLENQGLYLILSISREGNIQVLDHAKGNRIMAQALILSQKFKTVFHQYLSPQEAGLINALLLGDRSEIPHPIRQLFVQTGTAHILAISGQNVAIIAFLILMFLKILPLGKGLHNLLTGILLIGYALISGAQPPVVRATMMTIVFLGSFLLERETDSYNTLGLAALGLLLVNPFYLYNVGFQLSFISVWAILVFTPLIMKFFQRLPLDFSRRGVSWLCLSLAVSLAAWLGVAGLIAYYFQIITPVTILANLAVIPLMSASLALGLGLLMAGLFWPFSAPLLASCLHVSMNLMVLAVYLFDQFPAAYYYVSDVRLWQIIVYYLSLFILMVAPQGLRACSQVIRNRVTHFRRP